MIRIVYVSKSDASSYQTNKDILTSSFHYNNEHGVTGALVYGMGHYLQCIEGDDEIIHALYQRICNDERHHDIKLISETKINKRHFTRWHMSLMNISAYLSVYADKTFTPYEMTEEAILDLIDEVSKIV